MDRKALTPLPFDDIALLAKEQPFVAQLLKELARFGNEEDYVRVRDEIRRLKREGRIKLLGLAMDEQDWLIDILQTEDGEIWHLCPPDHAFRGYLKRGPLPDESRWYRKG